MIKGINRRIKNNKGFTLIELIVVIAILGILAAVAIPKLAGFTGSANEKAIEADVKTIETAAVAFNSVDPTTNTFASMNISQLTSYLDATITSKYADANITVPATGGINFDASGRVEDFTVKVGNDTYSYDLTTRKVTKN